MGLGREDWPRALISRSLTTVEQNRSLVLRMAARVAEGTSIKHLQVSKCTGPENCEYTPAS